MAGQARRTGHYILVFDDEADIQSALKEALEWHGYFVVTASNGQEALDTFLKIKLLRDSCGTA